MLNFLISLYSNTLGKWHWPLSEKKFKLEEYFEIEKKLRELPVPFCIILVTTQGAGSNIGIRLAQRFGTGRSTSFTHAIVYIDLRKGYKHRVAEAIGTGVQEASMLSAIGQRDEVLIRVPNPTLLNEAVCTNALEYIHNVLDRDDLENIPYDMEHSLDNKLYNCSELVYMAVKHGLEKADQKMLLKPVMRGGKKTVSPLELEETNLFVDLYDSRKDGFV